MFEPLAKDQLYQGIVDQITQSILKGKMRAGDQLPTETELAEHFNVSRTVVREAIRALSSQGLVKVTQGKGTFITQPTAENVIRSLQLILKLEDHSYDDLMAARYLLEVPIARLAAENASEANLKILSECVEEMHRALQDPQKFMLYDTKFHAELALATQNLVFSVLLQPLFMLLQAGRTIMVEVPGKADRSLQFHLKIYDAVKAHDGPAAEKAMREHLDQVCQDLNLARHSRAQAKQSKDGEAKD